MHSKTATKRSYDKRFEQKAYFTMLIEAGIINLRLIFLVIY